MELLAGLLSLIMQPCYDLTQNWWVAIFLFTVIVKVLLMPMALWCQKNAIIMVQLMPDLFRIKVKYFGDAETIGEKQNALYKEKHYHPLLSLIPLVVQIIILFGLVDVIHTITDHGAPGTEFLVLVPFEDGGLSWIMPILAGLSAVALGFAQNRINPLQKEQSRAEKNSTNGLSIALSLCLGIFVAAGMAFYWICSNLTAIAVQAICNICIKPKKYIDYADLEQSREEFETLNALNKSDRKWYQRDPYKKREKQDYKRFFKIVDKHIVFYSERSGFYKYFSGAIQWLLEHSNIRIHYVTNDPNDQIFQLAESQPRIFPYLIRERKAITLFMKMDADVVVTTQEDLDNYYIKRSYIRDDINYVFMFHHMTSTHLTALEASYDNFDTLLCVGPHQIEEIRKAEEQRHLKPKKLIECGYDLLDTEIRDYEAMQAAQVAADENSTTPNVHRPKILIAPSWQEDNLLDLCIEDMMRQLIGEGYAITVRPHPEYLKRYSARYKALKESLTTLAPAPDELIFEDDFSSNESIFTADLLITDWSSIACEYSFTTLRPTLFVDTPMKVGNPNWQDLGIEPTDISLRNQIGRSIDPHDLSGFGDLVASMLTSERQWSEAIESVREHFLFNLGHSAPVAGAYLLEAVLEAQQARAQKSPKTSKKSDVTSPSNAALTAPTPEVA